MADYSQTSPNEAQRLTIQRMLEAMDIAKLASSDQSILDLR